MFLALFNDFAQRAMTLNKWEQRRHLARRLQSLGFKKGTSVLDFGCGTALFAPTFLKMGFQYTGYDIDPRLISYAKNLYPKGRFKVSKEELKQEGPYDLILANCCFHHIADEVLIDELDGLNRLLAKDGKFIMIDLLLRDNDSSFLRRQFRKLEKGAFVRAQNDYQKLVGQKFQIEKTDSDRSHVLSLKGNVIYNDLVIFECSKGSV